MTKTISLENLKTQLIKRKVGGETWASMAREYNVNPATLWRIAKENYNPQMEETRDKLNLPKLEEREVWRDKLGQYCEKG